MVKLLAGLGIAFNREITEELVSVYSEALRDIPIEEVEARGAHHLRVGTFFPKPCDLRGESADALDAEAQNAADIAIRAAEQVGAWESVEFEDPCIGVAIRSVFITWLAFCRQDLTEWTSFSRAKFIAAYKAARKTGAHGITLLGIHEGDPKANGRQTLRIGGGRGLLSISKSSGEESPKLKAGEAR